MIGLTTFEIRLVGVLGDHPEMRGAILKVTGLAVNLERQRFVDGVVIALGITPLDLQVKARTLFGDVLEGKGERAIQRASLGYSEDGSSPRE
ncbi:MAG: hypothetical protein V3W41_15230 [Planctomycetota bacterium]